MGIQISKEAYEGLIEGDITALKMSNCRKLEKGHYTSGYVCRSINVPSLKYIHQLQQALRLCRLDELANNFQV